MTEQIETVNVTASEPVNVTEPDTPQGPEVSGPSMFDELEREAEKLTPAVEPENKSEIPTAQIAAGAFATTFNLIAPAWQIQKPECDALGEAWAPIIDKYLPGILDSIFGAAIATTLIVVGPRLGSPMKNKPKPKKPAPEEIKDNGQNAVQMQGRAAADDGGANAYGY